MASAWATLTAYGIMMLLSYFIGKKHYPVPYNIKKILSYLFSATLLSYVSFNYFRDNYLVSIGLLIIFAFLTYFNEKKEILRMLKRN